MNCTKNNGIWKLFTLLVLTIFSIQGVYATFQMEWGDVTPDNNTWVQINLSLNFTNPIVVASPEYQSTTDPYGISAWVTNITNTTFLIRSTNEHLNSTDDVTLHYLVVEEGSWLIPGTTKRIEARANSTTKVGSEGGGNWGCPANGDTITFSNAFASNPLVLSTRVTDANPNSWAVTFQNDPATETEPVTTTQMCMGLSQSKATSPGAITNPETIHWIALDTGNGTIGGVEFEVLWNRQDTGDSGGNWINGYGDSPPYSQSWNHTWTGSPNIIIVGQTSVGGTDGSWPVLYSTGSTASINMFVDEANERAHTGSESGGGIAFTSSGFFSAKAPIILNVSFNESFISINSSSEIKAIVTDNLGNNTVSSVIATVESNVSANNVTLTPSITNKSVETADLESGTQHYLAQTGGEVIGESGSVLLEDRNWTEITFTQTYNSTPVLLAVASTDNDGSENPYITIINSINRTHANITLCQDDGTSSSCGASYTAETVDYFVFDVNKSRNYSWIDVGFVDANTNGGNTAFTFNNTFAAAPLVWALPQTYNIGGGNMGGMAWFTSITTTGANLVACDHPSGAGGSQDACSGTAIETYGYVAIDIANMNISDAEGSTSSISNSAFTAVTFTDIYSTPRMMVGVVSESGAQDPKYPWARSVTGTGADIRYCEHDGTGDCDTHNAEDTAWFVMEEGPVKVGNGGDDTEKEADFVTYSNIFNQEAHNVTELIITVNVSSYNTSASTNKGNNATNLELQVFSTAGWVSLGDFNVSAIGVYNITTTNITILNSWSTKANRDLRLRPIYVDFATAAIKDEINWTDVIVNASYRNYNGNWTGVFDNTSICGEYNITTVYAQDTNDIVNVSFFTNRTLDILCNPAVTLFDPLSTTKIFGNGTINFTWFVLAAPGNLSCEFMINDSIYSTFNCTANQNITYTTTLGSGYYNWSVNATDSFSNEGGSTPEYFYNIIDRDMTVSKKIRSFAQDQYYIEINYINEKPYIHDTTIMDFEPTPFTFGSFNMLYNFSNATTQAGPFNGNVLGWFRNNTTFINYSATYPTPDAKLLDLYVIGLD